MIHTEKNTEKIPIDGLGMVLSRSVTFVKNNRPETHTQRERERERNFISPLWNC